MSVVVLTGTVELNGVELPVRMNVEVEAIRAALGQPSSLDYPRWIYGDKQLAAYLGWPLGKVQKLSARGRIPTVRIEGTQRKAYERLAVDEWLRRQAGGTPMA